MVLLCIEFVRWIHIHQCVWLDVADPMESECLTSDGLAMGQKAAKKNSCMLHIRDGDCKIPLDMDNNHQLMNHLTFDSPL